MNSIAAPQSDSYYMKHAITLATQQLGTTEPNPSVGCVIVKDDTIISEATTAQSGRPHAEHTALEQAGSNAKDSTVYVTLEPCSHEGNSGACARKLIQAGVSRVVIGIKDPNPLVNGAGIAMLEAAGIEVQLGVCADEAAFLHASFIHSLTSDRPYITLKIASSLDGKIALRTRESQWITGQKSRHFAHVMRSQYQAISVGVGTIRSDNPALTCRARGLEDRSPIRVIFDTKLTTPTDATIVSTAEQTPTYLVHSNKLKKIPDYPEAVTLIAVPVTNHGTLDLHVALPKLKELGIHRLLIEGGSTLITNFLEEELFDALYWFHAPSIIGNDGLGACGNMYLDSMHDITRLRLHDAFPIANDILSIYLRA